MITNWWKWSDFSAFPSQINRPSATCNQSRPSISDETFALFVFLFSGLLLVPFFLFFLFFIFYFLFFFIIIFFLVPFYHITTYKSRLAFLFTVSSYHPFSDRTRRWRRQKRGKQSTAIHHTPSSQPGLWVIARNLRVYLIIRSQIRNILTAGGDVEIPLNGVSLITEASLRASFVDIIFKKDPRENPRWDESKFQKYYTPLNFVLNDDYLWSIFFLAPYWRKIHWFP